METGDDEMVSFMRHFEASRLPGRHTASRMILCCGEFTRTAQTHLATDTRSNPDLPVVSVRHEGTVLEQCV